MTDPTTIKTTLDQLRPTLFAHHPLRYSLENGLTVLHRPDHSAHLISVQIWVKTGSIHEGQWLGSGISHYLEHMVFKGTAKREDGDIAREVQERGGSINAYTTFDRTVYYVNMPAEHIEFAIEMLADMVFTPSLRDEDAVKERDVILREIDMGLDDPDHRLSRSLFETAYRTHPYRLPVIGRKELFSALTGEDLRAYHAARYDPSNAVLVVSGAVEESALRKIVDAEVAKLPSRSVAPVMVPSEPMQLAKRENRLAGDVTLCRGTLAYRIPGLSHPDAPALDLLASCLGQGQSSQLWRTLRDAKQLVHEISAQAWNPGEGGLFWISYLCDPAKREVVEASIEQVIQTVIEKGVEKAALEKAQRAALVGEINSRKTVEGQASRLGLSEVVVGDLGYPQIYLERLEEQTPAKLREVAQRYLVKNALTAVSLNQKSADERPLPRRQSQTGGDDFQVRELSNGSKLIWQRDQRLPKVHLRFCSLGGAHYEPRELRGLTDLTATMLTKDTQWRSHASVSEAIEMVGGRFSEFAGNNSFGLSLEVLTQDLPLARTLLQDALLGPRFLPDVMERELAGLVAAVKERWDDNVERAHTLLRQKFFGDHPLAIEPGGTEETLGRIGIDDLRSYHERMLVGGNAVLVVTGDFDDDRDLALFEALLLDLPDWQFDRREIPFQPSQGSSHEVYAPREQSVVLLGFPDAGVCAPDELTAQVINAACANMASRLFMRVREEKNLAYFVSAHRSLSLNTGLFTFYAGTHPDAANEVLDVFHDEARRLREEGLTQDELDRARVRMKGRMRSSRQSIGSRASQAGLNALYGLPINDWKDYDERLDALTLADVQTCAAKQFQADAGVSLILGPKASI
jgi:zinc protease